MEYNTLLEVVPPMIAGLIVLVAAGMLGLFRSIALSKTAYKETVESLIRQIDVLKQENESLRAAAKFNDKPLR
jgi:uncharacterized membrane protein (DUF106 family)